MQKHKEIVRFLGGGCVRARVWSVSIECPPPYTPPSRRNTQYFRSANPATFPTSASRDSASDQPAKGIPAVNPAAGSGIVFHDLRITGS